MKRTVFRWMVQLSLPVAAAASLAAQRPTLERPEPIEAFPEPFSNIVGVRELPNGRVLIADRLEKHVSVLDFRTGGFDPIGREGRGPGEYAMPSGLFPLPDGQTLLVDFGNMRMSIIGSNLRIGESFPMMRQEGGMMFIRPQGTDENGNIYFSMQGVMMAGPGSAPTRPDSGAVLRYDPVAETFDTVAMIALAPPAEGGGGPATIRVQGGQTVSLSAMMPAPFAPRDTWAVSYDGTVHVARVSDYRIDRYAPDGTARHGKGTSYDPVRVTQAVKDRWADQRGNMQMSFQTTDGGGSRTVRMDRPDTDGVEFPEFLPPFDQGAAYADPDGRTWIRLHGKPGDPQRFDVFDVSGTRVKQVQLPPNTGLVGFGDGVFYAVTSDEDDLQWLARFPS